MKIVMKPQLAPKRGAEPKVGNVYTIAYSGGVYKIVVGITKPYRKDYKTVILIHTNAAGEIVGCSRMSDCYARDFQDLVGYIKEMPTMCVEWFKVEGT